ncbi:MAG TPA: iron-sulfur cluster assembly scaffold protein [Candidatus Saccharimonadales bacterium]|nr:iron-sulfur cluster assembly scaffold protein [Candidatus Saccharimonadales bacterium]
MFSRQVLDHFQNPRNSGELADATITIEVSNPVCGDVLRISAIIENARIADTRFLCRGCTTAIACSSFLTEELKGKSLLEAKAITAQTISAALGNLPAATFHGAQLAQDAARQLLARLK